MRKERAILFRLWTGASSYVVQVKRCVRDRVFAVIPAATGRGTYLTRDNTKGGAEKDVKMAWSATPLVSNNEPRYVFPVFTSFS